MRTAFESSGPGPWTGPETAIQREILLGWGRDPAELPRLPFS